MEVMIQLGIRSGRRLNLVGVLGGCLLLLNLGGPMRAIAMSPPEEAETPAETTTAPTTATPNPELERSESGPFFADILVRGQPVFQIGSLPGLPADERAAIINRRIASLLARSEDISPVTVNFDPQRNLAILQVRNRVIMTVTEQDALDFNEDVETLAQQWANELNQALAQPTLAIDVAQRLDAAIRQILRDAVTGLPAFLGALIVIALTLLLARVVRHFALGWAERTEGDRSTEILLGRLGYGGIWVLGSIVALGVLGLDFAALLGALGLTSVAIGFSLRDILSNYISGVILLAARPFRIGDQIVISDYEGTVMQIQLRATTINTYDGRQVYIPNQRVFQASITNNTVRPIRRSSVIIGIDYDADINQVKQVIQQALQQVEVVENDPPFEILVRELALSTVNIEARFWVNSQRMDFLAATSHVTQAIKEALQAAEIEMPTEIYTLMFRNVPPQENAPAQETQPTQPKGESPESPSSTESGQ